MGSREYHYVLVIVLCLLLFLRIEPCMADEESATSVPLPFSSSATGETISTSFETSNTRQDTTTTVPSGSSTAATTTDHSSTSATFTNATSSRVATTLTQLTTSNATPLPPPTSTSTPSSDNNSSLPLAMNYFVACTSNGANCIVSRSNVSAQDTKTASAFESNNDRSSDYIIAGALQLVPSLNETGWDILNFSFSNSQSGEEEFGASTRALSNKSPSTQFFTGLKNGGRGRQLTTTTDSHQWGNTQTPSSSPSSLSSLLSLDTQYYAIGYLEGFVTFKQIFQSYTNTYKTTIEALLTPDVANWLRRNSDWLYRYTSSSSASSATTEDLFGVKLSHLIMQLKGIANGYADGCAAATNTTNEPCPADAAGPLLANTPELAILAMQMYNELPDLYAAYTVGLSPQSSSQSSPSDIVFQALRNFNIAGQGSAIVKMASNDLLVGHTTIAPYQAMMRQYKSYVFEDGMGVSMSSYPGLLHSQDEWYTTSNGLSVTQTKLPIFNNSIFTATLKGQFAGLVPSFYRTMVANYLASNVNDWQQYFSTYPSGTNNNQWLVVDMKRVSPTSTAYEDKGAKNNQSAHITLQTGCVLVMETLPGLIIASDLTEQVLQNGYFASYNLAYFEETAELSGQTSMAANNGTYFSFGKSPRANQFDAFQSLAQDVVSLGVLLRMNKYDINTVDAPSEFISLRSVSNSNVIGMNYSQFSLIPNCSGALGDTCNPKVSAMLAISSRGDLNPVGEGTASYGYLYPFVGQMNLGGIDAKVTSYHWMALGTPGGGGQSRSWVISGPTYDDQPVFSFSKAVAENSACRDLFLSVPHEGLPDMFNFSFIEVDSLLISPIPTSSPETSKSQPPVGGITGAVVGGVSGIIVIVLISCTKKHKTPTKGYRPLTGNKKQLQWLAQGKAAMRQERLAEAEERSRQGGTALTSEPSTDVLPSQRRQSREVYVVGGTINGSPNSKPPLPKSSSGGNLSRQSSGGGITFGARNIARNAASSDNITETNNSVTKARKTSLHVDSGAPLSHAPAVHAASISSPVELGGVTNAPSPVASNGAKPKRSYKDYISSNNGGGSGTASVYSKQ